MQQGCSELAAALQAALQCKAMHVSQSKPIAALDVMSACTHLLQCWLQGPGLPGHGPLLVRIRWRGGELLPCGDDWPAVEADVCGSYIVTPPALPWGGLITSALPGGVVAGVAARRRWGMGRGVLLQLLTA